MNPTETRLALWMNFFWNFLIANAILVPYYRWLHLSFTEIALIQGVFHVTRTLSNYPLGVLADRLGARNTLLIAGLLKGIGGTILWISSGFLGIVISFFLIGIANGFYSGADLKIYSRGSESEFSSNIFSKVFFVQLAMAGSALVGAFVSTLSSFSNILMWNSFLAWIPLLLAAALKKEYNLKLENGFNFWKSFFEPLTNWDRSNFRGILILSLFQWIFFVQGQFAQSVMVYIKTPTEYFGIVFFVRYILSALISFRSQKIHSTTPWISSVALYVFPILSLLVVPMFKFCGIYSLLLLLFLDFGGGLASGQVMNEIRKGLPLEKIVGLSSLQDTIASLLSTGFIMILGLSIDRFGFDLSYQYLLLVVSFLVIIFYMLFEKKKWIH